MKGQQMVRCIRLFTGQDEASHAETGYLDLRSGLNDDLVSATMSSTHVSIKETAAAGSLSWHTAPVRQLVITLSGTLEFSTRDGQKFMLGPGDVLLAEDTVGSGHQWRLVDDDPWRRIYIVLAAGTDVPFIAD